VNDVSYILAAHGSSSAEANAAIREIALTLARKLDAPVTAAFLERAEPAIPTALDAASAAGARRIVLLPFFLMPGMHVTRDITHIVSQARERTGATIDVADYVGAHDGITDLLVDLAHRGNIAPDPVAPGTVWLVGAGPGDPELLTRKGARALASCDVLLYDYLVTDEILALAPPACERIFVGKRAGRHAMPQAEIIARMTLHARAGKNVVRLKGGDVFVFARGGEEAAALAAEGIPFEIVPGISSAIAVPAAAGIPVTHRDHNSAFTVVAGHEDPSAGPTSLDYERLADPKQTLIFLMATRNLRAIAERLIACGLPPDHPAAVVREGTRSGQETIVGDLATIADEAQRMEFTAPAVIIIGTVVRERERILAYARAADPAGVLAGLEPADR